MAPTASVERDCHCPNLLRHVFAECCLHWPILCGVSGTGVNQLWSLPSRREDGCRALVVIRALTGRYKVPEE